MPKEIINKEDSGNGNTGHDGNNVFYTQVPGVDMSQVIPSRPHIVKENSSRVEVKRTKERHTKNQALRERQ